MSTTPTTPTAPDANQLTPEQIADQLAAAAAPAAQPSAEPPQLQKEYVVETATGQVFRGKTQQEIIDKMKASVENGSKKIKELSSQPAAPAPAPAPAAEPQFDNNRYYQLLAEDPIKAQSYAFQFTPEAVEVRKQQLEQQEFLQSLRTQTVINQFKAETSDFPVDDESAQKFAARFDALGLPITVENLKLVHNALKGEGVYQPYQPAAQPGVGPAAVPVPTLGGNGAASQPTQPVNYNTMTTAELEAVLRSMQG